LLIEARAAGMRIGICSAAILAREAAARHQLASGSAGVLAQALAGTLLLAARDAARVDLQVECTGPLRGLLVDADETGAARGLVRVNDLAAPAGEGRFDARPLLASPHDERAGMLSILRAPHGARSPHRAAFPFAGGDLGAALTFFLRGDRPEG